MRIGRGLTRAFLPAVVVMALLTTVAVFQTPIAIRHAANDRAETRELAVPATSATERQALKGHVASAAGEHGGADTVVARLDAHATEPFTMLGVTWAGGIDPARVYVEARWKSGGAWSDWTELHTEADLAAIGRPATEPLWIGERGAATAAAVRVTSTAGATPQDVRLVTVDPGESNDVEGKAQALWAPPIVSRASWGARSAPECDSPNYAKYSRGAVIHHTVGSNSYTASESAGIVRGIQAYHMDSRDWCDIGYNFLVDKYGKVFEGRRGGVQMPVRGAHSSNYDVNMEAAGVSLMGTFTSTYPSADMRTATKNLVAWRFADWGLPAKGTYTSGGVTLNRIAGHRDVTSTECPGASAYSWVVGGLRDGVEQKLAEIAHDRTPRPQNFTVATTSATSLTYEWDDVPGAAGYVLTYSDKFMASPRFVSTTKSRGTITGLTSGRRYYVSVRPTDSAGGRIGPSSPIISGVPDLPPGPTLRISGTRSDKLGFAWTSIAGLSYYELQLSSSSTFAKFRTRRVQGLGYTYTNLSASTKYYARVRGVTAGGTAQTRWSSVISGTTRAASTASSPLPSSEGDIDPASLATAEPTITNDKVTFNGATSVKLGGKGYGHGIGMSQYGAYGGALNGWGYTTILKHYYPGTYMATTGGYMRVQITADDSYMKVKAKTGLKAKILDTGEVLDLWTTKNGMTADYWYIRPYSGDKTRSELRVRATGGQDYRLRLFSGDGQIQHSGALTLLVGSGSVAYRTAVRSVRPTGQMGRETINVLSLDNYIRGVVPREMPSTWPIEALKSQAVAARSYGVRDRNPDDQWDTCDTTSCQVYGGYSAEKASTNSAVAATAGRILKYDGEAAFTQFSSSSGGYTAPGSQPYLKAVSDGWDSAAGNNPNYSWGTTVNRSTVEQKLGISNLLSITFTDRNGFGDWGGRVGTVVFGFRDSEGVIRTRSRTGPEFRMMLGLKSHWLRFLP